MKPGWPLLTRSSAHWKRPVSNLPTAISPASGCESLREDRSRSRNSMQRTMIRRRSGPGAVNVESVSRSNLSRAQNFEGLDFATGSNGANSIMDDFTPNLRDRPGRKSACYAASEAGNPSADTDGSPFVRPAMSVVTASASRGHDLCAGGLLRP